MRKVNPNLNYVYNGLIINPSEKKYPPEFTNLLDSSQLNAIHKCLHYKIALIQGPPGTGKTHVGTILANLILQNSYEFFTDSYFPIFKLRVLIFINFFSHLL